MKDDILNGVMSRSAAMMAWVGSEAGGWVRFAFKKKI
jgi:hypothetical protein